MYAFVCLLQNMCLILYPEAVLTAWIFAHLGLKYIKKVMNP